MQLASPACFTALTTALSRGGHTFGLMRPFVSFGCSNGTDPAKQFDVNDRLIQQVASPTASPVRSVQTIARLLLVAWLFAVHQDWDVGPLQQARRAVGVFAALQRSLQDEGAAQAMRAELARMQSASSAVGNNSRVPTLEQLLAAAAVRELDSISGFGLGQHLPEPLPDEVEQLFRQRKVLAVRILERVQADSPCTHDLLGDLSTEVGSTDPSAGARAARHYRRGLDIARQQQSDWWTARFAYRLAGLATTHQLADIPPAEAAGLLAEADAAYRRCHTVLPWMWVAALKLNQRQGRAMRPAIEAHTQRDAAGWDSALQQLGSQGCSEGRAAVHLLCTGCGRVSLALRRCADSQGAVYCRWVANCEGVGGL